jgi:hypothetical protein
MRMRKYGTKNTPETLKWNWKTNYWTSEHDSIADSIPPLCRNSFGHMAQVSTSCNNAEVSSRNSSANTWLSILSSPWLFHSALDIPVSLRGFICIKVYTAVISTFIKITVTLLSLFSCEICSSHGSETVVTAYHTSDTEPRRPRSESSCLLLVLLEINYLYPAFPSTTKGTN